MNNLNIQELFYNHYSNLEEETILKMNEYENTGKLNNVIVGLHKHCFGLSLIDELNGVKYQIFYIRSEEKLVGDLIELTANLSYRDELVLYFSNFLAHNYQDIDLINTFNTFQDQTREMLEKIGFHTITSTQINKLDDPNPIIIAKGVKGIIPLRIIEKIEFYRVFFGNKKLSKELEGEFVYLMLNLRNDLIKIGKSKNPTFREKTLQADEPEIELITYWKAPSVLERRLHKQFKDKRSRGEWFKLNFVDLKQIKEIMNEFLE